MKTAAIITIGDEILLGRIVDTNSAAISRALDRQGIRTTTIQSVGDNAGDIEQALTQALDSTDVIITTGGLGPTKDDITKGVFLRYFGGELIRNAEVTANIRRIFHDKNLTLNPLTLDQALVPSTAVIINNTYGTAPIMVFSKNGKTVVAMPGVPHETEGMLPAVMEHLARLDTCGLPMRHETRLLTGISESELAERLSGFEDNLPAGYKLAYLPESPVIKLRLDGPANDNGYEKTLDRLDEHLATINKITVLATYDCTVAQAALDALRQQGYTVATAESCTGGRIAAALTSIPGASDTVLGGAVTYANSAKINILHVHAADIENHGAVSEPVVRQMSAGAATLYGAHCAVATSGIAGPGGGTPDKPVGTVWTSVTTPHGTHAQVYRFPGDRNAVVTRAVATVLIDLIKSLRQPRG